ERDESLLLRGHLLEDGVVRSPVQKRGRRKPGGRPARSSFEDPNDTVSVLVWQRFQQDGVNEAEDRGRGGNTDREDRHGHDRKPRIAGEHAASISNILSDRVHDRDAELIAIRVLGLSQSTHRAASRGTWGGR